MPEAAGLHFQIYNPKAPLPVVLIHGAGGNHLYWPSEIRRLPGVRTYALDLPGHGKSEGPGEQSIPGYVQALVYWLQAAGLHRAVFVGHSMGGAIAIGLALQHPDHVLALGLLGTSASMRVNPALIEDSANAARFERAIRNVISWSFGSQVPEKLSSTAYKRMADTRPSVLHGDFLACDGFIVNDRLGEITCPVLVLCGEEDKMTPVRKAQQLADSIPQARLEVVHGAGHMLMLEKPQVVADLLRRFLDRIRL
ncbi:MAG TPA: alpha/beta hydrolase [Anaerolineales bacterium]|nr:alpha/beta hydrolase [Anaerolineales bacterium]